MGSISFWPGRGSAFAASSLAHSVSRAAMAGCSVFVRGFDFGTTEEDVRMHCGTAGAVSSVTLKGLRGRLIGILKSKRVDSGAKIC